MNGVLIAKWRKKLLIILPTCFSYFGCKKLMYNLGIIIIYIIRIYITIY